MSFSLAMLLLSGAWAVAGAWSFWHEKHEQAVFFMLIAIFIKP